MHPCALLILALNETLTYKDVIFANKKQRILRDCLQYILTFCLLGQSSNQSAGILHTYNILHYLGDYLDII